MQKLWIADGGAPQKTVANRRQCGHHAPLQKGWILSISLLAQLCSIGRKNPPVFFARSLTNCLASGSTGMMKEIELTGMFLPLSKSSILLRIWAAPPCGCPDVKKYI